MPHAVFISYCDEDRAAAESITRHLESHGIPCWIAPRNVPSGAIWADELVRAVQSTRLMVLIFSSRCQQSGHVFNELNLAFDYGTVIIPVRVENTKPEGKFGYFLQTRQWLDAYAPPLEQHLDLILSRVQSALTDNGGQPNAGDANPAKGSAQPPMRKKHIQVALITAAAIVSCAALAYFISVTHGGSAASGKPSGHGGAPTIVLHGRDLLNAVRAAAPLPQLTVESIGKDRVAVRGVVAGPGELSVLRERMQPYGESVVIEATGDAGAIAAHERVVREALTRAGATGVDVNTRWRRPDGPVTAVIIRFKDMPGDPKSPGVSAAARVNQIARAHYFASDLVTSQQDR